MKRMAFFLAAAAVLGLATSAAFAGDVTHAKAAPVTATLVQHHGHHGYHYGHGFGGYCVPPSGYYHGYHFGYPASPLYGYRSYRYPYGYRGGRTMTGG